MNVTFSMPRKFLNCGCEKVLEAYHLFQSDAAIVGAHLRMCAGFLIGFSFNICARTRRAAEFPVRRDEPTGRRGGWSIHSAIRGMTRSAKRRLRVLGATVGE
jgi:hypothetical protein